MKNSEKFRTEHADIFKKMAELQDEERQEKVDSLRGKIFKMSSRFTSPVFVFVIKAKGIHARKATHVFTLELSGNGIESNERLITDFDSHKPIENLFEVGNCLEELKIKIKAI